MKAITLKYEAAKGTRIKSYGFYGVDVLGMGWDAKNRQWVSFDGDGNWTSTEAPCHSVRAFKRMLRKHPHIQGKAYLCHKYKNYGVEG